MLVVLAQRAGTSGRTRYRRGPGIPDLAVEDDEVLPKLTP
jgi:hypothetical protein